MRLCLASLLARAVDEKEGAIGGDDATPLRTTSGFFERWHPRYLKRLCCRRIALAAKRSGKARDRTTTLHCNP